MNAYALLRSFPSIHSALDMCVDFELPQYTWEHFKTPGLPQISLAFPPRFLLCLLFAPTAIFAPGGSSLFICLSISSKNVLCISYSALIEFWNRETKVRPLCQSFRKTLVRPKQTNIIPWEQSPFCSLWNQVHTLGIQYAIFETGTMPGREWARLNENTPKFSCLVTVAFFLVKHSLGCCKPFTTFQSSIRLILTGFFGVSGGELAFPGGSHSIFTCVTLKDVLNF